MSKHIFVARFKYGKPALARVAIIKETPKTYTASDSEDLIGRQYIGKRIMKDTRKPGIRVFTNGTEALEYLVQKAREYVIYCERQLDHAKEECIEIECIAHKIQLIT